jgi:alanyl-tRNA synthetase
MQQHTGQHILSHAFVHVAGIDTVSFHLGEQLSTIDLDRAPLDPAIARRAEQRANDVVFGDIEVISAFVDRDQASALPLRKMPSVEGPIRIVQVQDVDWSPCGGTHVEHTGQTGPIKIVRVERRKKQTRVHFVCGWRALSDYAHKHEIVHHLASHLTTSESEIVASVERLESDAKALRKELANTQLRLLDTEVAEWIAQADQDIEALDGKRVCVVRRVFDQRDVSLLKEAARRLVARPRTVALLATRQPRPQFVFARSDDLPDKSPSLDMGVLIRLACAEIGGRGGGRPMLAQGGAPEGASVEQALDVAVRQLGNP